MLGELLKYLESITPQPPATPPEVYEHYEQGLSAKDGFWGEVDSGVDWCELNYAITPFIAEFFNTLSSIPMVLWSLAGAYFTYRYATKELSFQCCFFAGAMVGLGSAMFHGSLRFSAQLFDEIPMLIHEVTMLYVVSNIHSDPRMKNNELNYVLMIILILMVAIVTFLYVWTGQWYIFLLVYGSVVILVISICMTFVIKSTVSMKVFFTAILVYFVSWILWLMDLYYCQLYQPYQLHSLWHLGAGYGSYMCMLVMVMERLHYLSQLRDLIKQNTKLKKKDCNNQYNSNKHAKFKPEPIKDHREIYELKMSTFLVPYASLNNRKHIHVDGNGVDIHVE